MLKTLLLKQRINKSKNQRFNFAPYNEVDLVGILFTEQQPTESLNYLQKELQADGKQIKLLMKVQKFDKHKDYSFPYFLDKDIGISGSLESKPLETFVKSPLHLLLVLDSTLDTHYSFVVSKCNALKIGFYDIESPIEHLDLLVKPSSEASKYKDLLAYIRKIA